MEARSEYTRKSCVAYPTFPNMDLHGHQMVTAAPGTNRADHKSNTEGAPDQDTAIASR
jgi:hypothetical protein